MGVGLLSGVVGFSGGFLIVPALTLPARVAVKRAASMLLWIIAANSAAGPAGYLGHVPITDVLGGFPAWKQAGLPVVKQRGVIPLERQVRIAAGALVLGFRWRASASIELTSTDRS